MAPISINLKLISCKDLKSFNFFRKQSIYATISLVCEEQKYQQHKTPVDREGDGSPEWNHQIQLDLSKFPPSFLNQLCLEIDLLSEGGLVLFGDKTIGQVRVPVKDLIEESNGALRFMTYQVMTTDGKPNSGVLEFSYKVIYDAREIQNSFQKILYSSPSPINPPSPPPPPPEVPEFIYHASPPQTPLYFPQEVSYVYPPPPPPPSVVYHASTPPMPYGYDAFGEYNICSDCQYSAPCYDEACRQGFYERKGRGLAAGSWNVMSNEMR